MLISSIESKLSIIKVTAFIALLGNFGICPQGKVFYPLLFFSIKFPPSNCVWILEQHFVFDFLSDIHYCLLLSILTLFLYLSVLKFRKLKFSSLLTQVYSLLLF